MASVVWVDARHLVLKNSLGGSGGSFRDGGPRRESDFVQMQQLREEAKGQNALVNQSDGEQIAMRKKPEKWVPLAMPKMKPPMPHLAVEAVVGGGGTESEAGMASFKGSLVDDS